MAIFFETSRLILRDWHDNDFPTFAKMNADPRVMEFFLECKTEEESRIFFKKIKDEISVEGFGLFATERKMDGELLGFVGLHRCDFQTDFSPCVEISWRIGAPFWGNGYASEAAKRCLDFGFSSFGLREIFAFTSLPNFRSRRVMGKLNMHFVKEFDHPSVPKNHPLQRHVLFRAKAEMDSAF